MTRQKNSDDESKIFDIFWGEKLKFFKDYKNDENQIDKPDFGLIRADGKKIGIEIVMILNENIEEAEKVFDSDKNNKAQKRKNNFFSSDDEKFIHYSETNTVTDNLFSKEILKKFKNINCYKYYSNETILLIASKIFRDQLINERLRVQINNFCHRNKCPYRMVYLVDLENKYYVGMVYDRKRPKKLKSFHLSARIGEDRVSGCFKAGIVHKIYSD